MKKSLLTLLLLSASILSYSQFIHKIKADSVLITNDSCNAELNLENSTKDTLGFLYNKGKGRTEFRRGLIRINDSLYIIGNDTLNTAKGIVSGNYIQNQNATAQAANYNISGTATSNQVWTDRLYHSNGRSGIRFSRFNNTYEEHFFNNNFNRSISLVELSDIAFLQALTDSGTPWKRLVLSVYPTGHIDFQPSVALNKNIRFNKNGNVNIGDSTDLGHKLQVNGKSLFRDTIRSITPLISNAAGYDMIVRRRTDSAFYRLPFDSIVGGSSYTAWISGNHIQNQTAALQASGAGFYVEKGIFGQSTANGTTKSKLTIDPTSPTYLMSVGLGNSTNPNKLSHGVMTMDLTSVNTVGMKLFNIAGTPNTGITPFYVTLTDNHTTSSATGFDLSYLRTAAGVNYSTYGFKSTVDSYAGTGYAYYANATATGGGTAYAFYAATGRNHFADNVLIGTTTATTLTGTGSTPKLQVLGKGLIDKLVVGPATAEENGVLQIYGNTFIGGTNPKIDWSNQTLTLNGLSSNGRLLLTASGTGNAFSIEHSRSNGQMLALRNTGSTQSIYFAHKTTATLTSNGFPSTQGVVGHYKSYNLILNGGTSWDRPVSTSNSYLEFLPDITGTTSSLIKLEGITGPSGYKEIEQLTMSSRIISPNGDHRIIIGTTSDDGTNILQVTGGLALNGKQSIGASSATALLHLGAGASNANSTPLKFTAGTNLTTPENGAVEYDGTNYFVTSGNTRYTLAKTLTATATLDFSSTAAQSGSNLTITVAGVTDGDAVSLGVPNAAVNDNSSFSAWVSGTNTVTVRFNNYSSTAIDPASGTFRVTVNKY